MSSKQRNQNDFIMDSKQNPMQVKNMYYYTQKSESLWHNKYRTCDKIFQQYHGLNKKAKEKMRKKQIKWQNSVGSKRTQTKKQRVRNHIKKQRRIFSKRQKERIILQSKCQQKSKSVKIKTLNLSQSQIDKDFHVWQETMQKRQRQYYHNDNVLNNINNQKEKFIKQIATKKALEMDQWAIKNISQNFMKEKALFNFQKNILSDHRKYLRQRLSKSHQEVFDLEEKLGIVNLYNRRKKSKKRRRSVQSRGRAKTIKKLQLSGLSTKRGQKQAPKSVRVRNSNYSVATIQEDPFESIPLEDFNTSINSSNATNTDGFRKTTGATGFKYKFKGNFKRNYKQNPYYVALSTSKNKVEGYTLRVNPLKHRDYRGLLLSDIDKRTLHNNTPKGVQMYQQNRAYDEIMKRDQVIRPPSQASPPKYTPEELNTFFKTRGSVSWKSNMKSTVRNSINGSQGQKDFSRSQSQIMDSYRSHRTNVSQKDSVIEFQEDQDEQTPRKPNSQNKSNIDKLLVDMQNFEQKHTSGKVFTQKGYPQIQLAKAKQSQFISS